MSSEYARSGGIDVSSGPSGTARPAMITVARMTRSGRTMKLMSAPVLSPSPKKISSGRAELDRHLDLGHEEDERQQQRPERRDGDAPGVTAPQDPQADAEEARHEQEVAEEADVDDVGRDPADQQQLDEQDARGRQEQPDGGTARRAINVTLHPPGPGHRAARESPQHGRPLSAACGPHWSWAGIARWSAARAGACTVGPARWTRRPAAPDHPARPTCTNRRVAGSGVDRARYGGNTGGCAGPAPLARPSGCHPSTVRRRIPSSPRPSVAFR